MSDTEAILARDITREQLVTELRRLQPAFRADGVEHMMLFGSRARADNRLDSDVDLMIDVVPGQKFSLVEVAGIGLSVANEIGLTGNIFLRRSAAKDLVDEANREGIVIF